MPESKRRKPKNRSQSQKAMEAATKTKEPSPTWYVALMAGLMVVGVVLVLLRFILDWPQTLLLIGLGCIAAGFMMTTNYR
jgi:1,4-dihydroxy-2-naphthoate octaprenyltransferase